MAVTDTDNFGQVFPVSEAVVTQANRQHLSELLTPKQTISMFEGEEVREELSPTQLDIVRNLGGLAREGLQGEPDPYRLILLRGGHERWGCIQNMPFQRRYEPGDAPEDNAYYVLRGRHFLAGRSFADNLRHILPNQLLVVSVQTHVIEVPPEALVLGLSYRG